MDSGACCISQRIVVSPIRPISQIGKSAASRSFAQSHFLPLLGLKVIKQGDDLEVTWNFGQKVSKDCTLQRCTAAEMIS